jgi:galactokinase
MGRMSAPAERVETEFAEAFGGKPDGRWWAPGRVNLIGEHTDYNDGFVLPLALQQGVAAAARVIDEPVLRVRSVQQGDTVEVPLAEIAPGAVDGWSAYVAGVAWALRETGHEVPGLEAIVDGDVPPGAGLSSSAALECVVAVAWNDLAGLELSRDALAAVTRSAENDVVGAPTGGMDQMASLHGTAGNLVFLDMRSLAAEQVPFDLAAAGLALLVVDSKAPHAHVDGEYAERRRSCEQAARILGVPALRDVSTDGLDDALGRLGDGPGGDLLRKRVRHIVTENARVLDVVGMLRAGGDPRRIGPALTASHTSMRDDFEITVPEVDTAVAAALEAGAHGARMTGGGFGGCVLALVEADAVEPVVRAVEAAFAGAGYRPPSAFVAEASDGARRL